MTDLIKPETHLSSASRQAFLDASQLGLLGDTIMKGATPEELNFFGQVCERTKLDPFRRQIYATKRWDSKLRKQVWTFQTGIDGYRAIAQRTAAYAGSDDPTFLPADESAAFPTKATVTVWKAVAGQRVPFTASARWEEYKQTGKEGQLIGMWEKMPYAQLAKCFDEETEILTSNGFKLFKDVTAPDQIAEVSEDRTHIRFTRAKPFRQKWTGSMVRYASDMIDFCVTPNHDMVTSDLGNMEARAMFALASTKSVLRIPMRTEPPTIPPSPHMQLIGYILADGTRSGDKWKISVSKAKKRKMLDALNLHKRKRVRHSCGAVASTSTRDIRSNFDQTVYTYSASPLLTPEKTLKREVLENLPYHAARDILDAWQQFDGSTNKKTGVMRIYATDPARVAQIEVLAVQAGYSISTRKERTSDISSKVNICFTLTKQTNIPIKKWNNPPNNNPSISMTENKGTGVWCVTVPTGMIIVRRNGFSMICGNCAESLALRKAFPEELSGVYTDEEMQQASNDAEPSGYTLRKDEPAPTQETAPETTPEPSQVREIEAEIVEVDTDGIPDSIACMVGGRWKDITSSSAQGTLGSLDFKELCTLREQMPDSLRGALLATYIDQTRALLKNAGTEEAAFAFDISCNDDFPTIDFPADLWSDPSVYPELLKIAKAITL